VGQHHARGAAPGHHARPDLWRRRLIAEHPDQLTEEQRDRLFDVVLELDGAA
jgi:hypothetical protein